jgi:hypothetical protein
MGRRKMRKGAKWVGAKGGAKWVSLNCAIFARSLLSKKCPLIPVFASQPALALSLAGRVPNSARIAATSR